MKKRASQMNFQGAVIEIHIKGIYIKVMGQKGKDMKNRQKRMALLLCAVLSASVIGGCGQTAEEETAEDVAVVETTNPEVGTLTLSANFIATISPDESVYVIPKTTAEVLEVLVEAGDVVEEGDVLAVLDDTMAQFTMRNAETAAKNAQIGLDSARLAYDLQYGEGATTLNDMQSDNTISQAEDGVSQLQEGLVDAMDTLQKTKDQLKEKEDELKDLKKKYEIKDNVNEIKDYADSIDKSSPEGLINYITIMQRYQTAAQEVGTLEATIAQYKSAVDQCEEAVETLQNNIDTTYDSYKKAVTANNISNGEMLDGQKQASQNTISQAEIGISQAQLGIEQAQESLETYTIKATISGVIETVNLKEHDFATSSNPAFVISNKNTMVATYYVSEDVRNTFSTGQKITLEKDDKLYDGEVIEIGSAIDATTGLFKIKAAVRGDTSNLLTGTKATVTTDTYHEKNVVIIPYDSVYYDGTQAYVYTVVDGKAQRTEVLTGLYDIDRIVITEGLTKDDTIITTWSAQLRDGVEVSTRESGAGTEQNVQE